MAVFHESVITYKGVDYAFTPAMSLIRSIERGDGGGPVSIMEVVYGANTGKPQLSFMAWLVAKVMNYAGLKMSEEEFYADMYDFDQDAFALYRDVIEAISPSGKEPKKDKPPEE